MLLCSEPALPSDKMRQLPLFCRKRPIVGKVLEDVVVHLHVATLYPYISYLSDFWRESNSQLSLNLLWVCEQGNQQPPLCLLLISTKIIYKVIYFYNMPGQMVVVFLSSFLQNSGPRSRKK